MVWAVSVISKHGSNTKVNGKDQTWESSVTSPAIIWQLQFQFCLLLCASVTVGLTVSCLVLLVLLQATNFHLLVLLTSIVRKRSGVLKHKLKSVKFSLLTELLVRSGREDAALECLWGMLLLGNTIICEVMLTSRLRTKLSLWSRPQAELGSFSSYSSSVEK